ncbi:hypothetical protein GJ496_009423 [Pomphorhynchus laevis]|nr:hypothetical protein GJ496_009423 [Pomphorhynchus laevis]
MSYNIIGCIGHIGEISFGHYVATCKNLRGYPRQWFYLNDDCVCSTKASDATLVRYFENPLSCSMYEYESGSKREPSYAYIVLYESEYERKKRDIKLPINYDSNELQSEIELFVQNQAQCELYNIYNEMPPSPITSIQSFNRSRSLSRSSSIRTFCSNASDSSTVKVNVKNSDHLLNDADTKIINFKVNTSSSVMDMYFDVLKSNDYYQFLASISNVIRMNWSDDIPIVLTGLHIALQWFFVSIKFIPSHITNSFMLLISSISWAKLNEELIVEQIRLSTMTDPNIFMQCLSVPNRIRRELLIMFFFEIVLGPNIDKMPHLPCTHALFEMSIIFLNELVDYGKTIFIQYLSKLELFIKTSYKNLLYFYNHGIIYLLSQLLYKKDLAIDSGKRQHSLRPIFTNKENGNNNWIALSVQEVISMIILNINLEYYGCQNIEAFQSNYICFKDKPLLPLLSEVRVYLSGSINSSFFTMLEYLILSCSNDKLENTITIRLATVLCASSAHMSIKMCDLFSNIIAYCYHRDDANFVETIKYIAHQDKFTDFRFYRIFYMEEIGSISKLGLLTTIKTSREIYKHCISIHCIWNLLLANSNVTDYINSEADVLLATSKKISSEIQGFEYDDNTLITIHKALAYISQIISMIRNDS